jgi:hypothetical protein
MHLCLDGYRYVSLINVHLFLLCFQNTVFPALTEVVQDARNFKVRISAASALSVPSNRQQYGSCYISTWTALLSGLDNSQNMDDFSEYQHRDNLLNQVNVMWPRIT